MRLSMHGYWVGGGVVGPLLGSVVPSSVRGLDFALVGLFLVLAVDAFRARRSWRAARCALCGSLPEWWLQGRCCSSP